MMMQMVRGKARGGTFTVLAKKGRSKRLAFAAVLLETLFGDEVPPPPRHFYVAMGGRVIQGPFSIFCMDNY